MAAQYKTLCPHCGAQFKIGVDQLKQARGKVRCGSCLEVFQATQNLVDDAGNPVSLKRKQPARQSGQQQQGEQQRSRPSSGQGQAGAGQQTKQQPSRNQQQPAQRKQQKQQAQQKPQQGQSSQQAGGQEPEEWTLPEEKPSSGSGESSGAGDKGSTASGRSSVSLDDSELSESLLSLDEEGDHWGTDDFGGETGTGDNDESWAEQLLEELEEDDSGSKKKEAPAEPPSPNEMSLFDEWGDDDESAPESGESAPDPSSAPAGEAQQADEDTDFFSLGLDDGSEPDFIDLASNAQEEPAPARKRQRPAASLGTAAEGLKWGALSVLAVAVLAVQHLAFNFSELARQPDWRPLYAQVCELAGCSLPQRASMEQLRGANLVVRSHPEVDNALVVDAIVFNEADHPQPFPHLELTFASIEDEPIASRRFTPDEYRAGELRDMEFMPPDTPIHVSFEILDPGDEAVNYSLRFHPPAPGRG